MRLNQLLKSKIHHARITYTNAEYVGSIEIDGQIMDAVDLMDGELVHIWSVDSDTRVITYAFRGPRGVVGINGGAAWKFKTGERIIIAAFAVTDEQVIPKIVLLGDHNEIVRHLKPFSITG